MIESAIIQQQSSSKWWGAIYRSSSDSTLKVNNGRFLANQATAGSGGAINLGCCSWRNKDNSQLSF